MKKLCKILRTTLITLLAMMLGINLYFIGARMFFNEALPTLFGYSQATVLSGSMEPAFAAGDMLIYKTKESYEIGDIVIYSQGNSLITHRIVGEENDGFITKGDANNTEDAELLSPEDVRGEVVYIIPNMGDFIGFFNTPLGIFIVILIGFALIEMPNMLEDRKRKRVIE